MTDVIRDLPRDDRPRERMMMHGAGTLSNAELVAILLGSGMRGKNAIQLARDLLHEGMVPLSRRDVRTLDKIPGIGTAKIARVFAAFELSRRIVADEPEDPPDYDPSLLGRTLIGESAHHRQERLGAVFLDSRQRVLERREIYVGTINNALVSTRDIIACALLQNATGIVAYHNHPSGNPEPSEDDMKFTKKLTESLALIDIELVDHLIIGAHRYYSMQEKGLM
jgi:DNA repair protein RadC